MKKTITITYPMQVKIGDKAYFKNYDFGFTVLDVDEYNESYTLKVDIPISEDGFWADSSLFDHATREVKEPEWPNPHDLHLHVYLGADGVRYIYNPTDNCDSVSWTVERQSACHSREVMEVYYRDALPLTELKLVPAKDDDDEQ